MGSIGISDIDIHQDRWEDDDWAHNIRPFPTTGPYFGPKGPFLRPKSEFFNYFLNYKSQNLQNGINWYLWHWYPSGQMGGWWLGPYYKAISYHGSIFWPKNGQNKHFSSIFLTTSPRSFKIGSIDISDIIIHQDRRKDDDWAHNIRPFLTTGPYIGPKNGLI